jgi:DNA-binding transcriptional regulator YdaS (Cro superfamily)
METPNNFNKLLIEFKTVKGIAYALSVSESIVYQWKNKGIPVKYLKDIAQLTDGRLQPYDLRPDLLPNFNQAKLYQNPVNAREIMGNDDEKLNHIHKFKESE